FTATVATGAILATGQTVRAQAGFLRWMGRWNLLSYQSLPTSIPFRQATSRRRKDESGVGTASRGIVKRLRRFSLRLRPHGGPTVRLRCALSTLPGDRSGSAQCATLPGGLAVRLGPQEC